MRQSAKTKLVYVTGLHAVQFGNNWIQKIPLTAKLDWTVKLGNFDRPHNFFHPFFFFPNWTGGSAETQSYVVVQVKHKMANDMLQQNFRGWTLNPNRTLDANKNKGRLYLKHSFLQNTALKSRNPLKRRYNP